jgi:hypothetical protein
LLPKGRKRDDLRLQYDVSAARVHLHEITRLLKAAHGGQIPTVPYDPQHPKAEHLGAERYLYQWNGRHLSTPAINSLIRLVLHGVVLVDRSGERISVTSHLLRHAAATVQRQQYGVPLETLNVGDRDVRVSMRRRSHIRLSEAEYQAAVDAITT